MTQATAPAAAGVAIEVPDMLCHGCLDSVRYGGGMYGHMRFGMRATYRT